MFEIFIACQFNSKKAKEYGFIENQGIWTYSSPILQGDFLMRITVEDSDLRFQVFDQETGDLYPQVHMESMRGTFVGSVREACLEVLYDIRKSCFEVQDYICPQTKRIMTLVQENYENQLEYLWEIRASRSGVFLSTISSKLLLEIINKVSTCSRSSLIPSTAY